MSGAPVTRRSLLGGLLATAGTVAAFPLTGCAPNAPRLRIATGEPGGTYVQFGELLATALTERRMASEVEVVRTGGSVANLDLLRAGRVDLAMSLIDAARAAPTGISAIGRVYQNYLQCLVLVDGPVRTVFDLAGRTVSVGARGSGTARTARLMLSALGIENLTRVESTLHDAVDALASGAIDGLLWSGGIPLPEAERIGYARLRLLDLTPALDRLDPADSSAYDRTVVPAQVYAQAIPTPTIGVANLLLCRPAASADLARGLVDILIEDAAQLVPGPSAGLQYLTPSTLIDTAPIRLHPAAEEQYSARYG